MLQTCSSSHTGSCLQCPARHSRGDREQLQGGPRQHRRRGEAMGDGMAPICLQALQEHPCTGLSRWGWQVNPAAAVQAVAELLAHLPAPLIKELIDIVESKHPDPIAEFEARRDAHYAA